MPKIEKDNCTKICSKCRRKKHFSKFYKNKSTPDGLSYQCISCKKKIVGSDKYKKGDKIYKRKHYLKYKPNYLLNSRKARLKNNFGLTLEDYNDLFNQQNGCCVICGRHQTEINHRLAVDHNHQTGKVRALLCNHCNGFLGNVEKHPELLNSILEYLEYYND